MHDDGALDGINDRSKKEQSLAEEIVERCVRIIANVDDFKRPRLQQLQKYRDLYAGRVRPKYRQPFNVVLPVFAGTMDTLMAAFNDDLALEFVEQEPSDYLKVKKYNALWQMESTSIAPTAKFALKTRWDRANALFSGRGFMMNYAASTPEYKNCFEIFELEDAIFQPTGGGIWQLHMYSGRQNIVRSRSQLENGPYDKRQVKELFARAARTDFYPMDDEEARDSLAKFRAMGLSVQSSDYIGEQLYKLVEMRVTVNGTNWYIVFSPWYKTWVRFSRLRDVNSADLDPWVSWSTHEDNKNFLNKSYADDMYGIADATHTMFNQELTNREKRNFNPRGYDPDMVKDVAKLDQAQYRPDALFPVHVPPGKRIEDGIFTFETPELRGTIDLINWMNEEMGRSIGVTDLSMGGVENVSKKATVVFAEQQNISKRLLLRSSSYTEAMGEIGKLFIIGCADHMPARKAIRMLGAEGEGWDEITRDDLDLKGDVDVRVISSSVEMRNSQLKKEARMRALEAIAANPALVSHVNPKALVEEQLRSGGEFDDSEIAVLMDVKNYGNKDEVARAHKAIQEIRQGKQADLYYGATSLFMEIIHSWANDHRHTLGERKFLEYMDFIAAHKEIAVENTLRKAQEDAIAAPMAPGAAPADPVAPPTPGDPSVPPVPSVSQFANELVS